MGENIPMKTEIFSCLLKQDKICSWKGTKVISHPTFSFVVLRISLSSFGPKFPQRRRSSRDRKEYYTTKSEPEI